MAGTFISYRREDAAGYAGRLRESLERRLGSHRVFRDVDALRPGQDFVQAIDARLAECQVMLVVIGREWLDARLPSGARRLDEPYDFVRVEVAAALARPNVLVVPVLVEGMSMPPSSALPEAIRPLARRHAVSIRDETWDADVERLVTIGDSADTTGGGSWPPRTQRALTWVAGGAVAAALIVVALMARPGAPPATGATDGARPMTPAVDPSPAAPFTPYTIDVPRLAEAAFADLIYTVVSGNVVARDTSRELRLRLRLANFGSTPANFWAESFRLQMDAGALTSTSQLNSVMDAHSLGYAVVTFRLPTRFSGAALRIQHGSAAADIPLDLSSTGRPPVDEQAEIADSSSQAVTTNVPTDPSPLIEIGAAALVVERALVRRFVNTTRLTLALRIRNAGQTALFSGDIRMRASADGGPLAPWQFPGEAVPAQSTISATATFDLPTSAKRTDVRATLGTASAERSFALP